MLESGILIGHTIHGAYGGKNKNENIGCLKDPFPDITLGIVVMHYLTDARSGGTLVVPGSHKFGIPHVMVKTSQQYCQ